MSQHWPDTTVDVNLDISELKVSNAKTKATYEEIKSYVQEKHSLKVTNIYITQFKRECGIVERENYNKPKSPDNKQPGCPEEKVKAIEDTLRHFQMIE